MEWPDGFAKATRVCRARGGLNIFSRKILTLYFCPLYFLPKNQVHWNFSTSPKEPMEVILKPYIFSDGQSFTVDLK
jgi:hypothetical protein